MKRPTTASFSAPAGEGNTKKKSLPMPKPVRKTVIKVEKTERKVETSSSTTSLVEYEGPSG